jgi:hypothetical protein
MASSLRIASLAALALGLSAPLLFAACTVEGTRMRIDGGNPVLPDGAFICLNSDSRACIGSVLHSCLANGEFLTPTTHDCNDDGRICIDGIGCAVCSPNMTGCRGQDVVLCSADGQMETVTETCDITMGETCIDASCQNLCNVALSQRSYVGCEFYAADLDNAVVESGDASAQQYAIVVSNAGQYTTEVTIERNTGTFGGTVHAESVQSVTIGPGDLEIFRLPRREVDGSSSFGTCTGDAACNAGEHCYCMGGASPGPGVTDCHCRNAPTATGRNDGTHSALTSNAYRIHSTLPVVAYQFNPLDNVGVFSNDASLLLPTSAAGTEYNVVTWPQTIADSADPAHDFISGPVHDEDLRSFLTVIGTADATTTTITLGPHVVEVHGVPGFPGPLAAGDVLTFHHGPFDVINLETHGFDGDFTGTIISSNNGVSVMAGSEASDAPRVDDLANRQCCADHLEESLFPNSTLGLHFYIGRTPPRSVALNHAFITTDSVGEFNEPEYVRVLAIDPGMTQLTTTLPFPNDVLMLSQGQDVILTATQDFRLDCDKRVGVMQIMASQQATGIANEYPGGDPSLIAIPPIDQYRSDYVFLTPLYYGFDFVTIIAPAMAQIQLDGVALDPNACTVSAADGIVRMPTDDPPTWLVYHCQLSFPDVIGLPNIRVEDGIQHDGYHTLQATQPISLVVSGFDRFVSYAYAGGLNLHPLM